MNAYSSVSSSALSDTPATSARVYPGLLKTADSRKAFRAAWRAYLAHPPTVAGGKAGPSARDMVVFCLLLGKPLDIAFTPVTNTVKLANGQAPYGTLAALSLASRYRGLTLADLLALVGPPAAAADSFPTERDLVTAARALDTSALLANWTARRA